MICDSECGKQRPLCVVSVCCVSVYLKTKASDGSLLFFLFVEGQMEWVWNYPPPPSHRSSLTDVLKVKLLKYGGRWWGDSRRQPAAPRKHVLSVLLSRGMWFIQSRMYRPCLVRGMWTRDMALNRDHQKGPPVFKSQVRKIKQNRMDIKNKIKSSKKKKKISLSQRWYKDPG